MSRNRPEVCPHRFEMAKALAAAFASRATIPSSNRHAGALAIVKLADELVSQLEDLEAGMLEADPTQDTYEDL